jgi:hypothetical protein
MKEFRTFFFFDVSIEEGPDRRDIKTGGAQLT